MVDIFWFDEIRCGFRIAEDIPGHLRERRNISPARYFASSDDAVFHEGNLTTVPSGATHQVKYVVRTVVVYDA